MTHAPSDNVVLLNELKPCELSVWEALKNGDIDADVKVLDEGFLGVYPDGFAGKDDHTSQLLAGRSVSTYQLDKFHVLRLGEEHALLSYRARFVRASSAHSETMYVSSIWRCQSDGWINFFSQDTPHSEKGTVPPKPHAEHF